MLDFEGIFKASKHLKIEKIGENIIASDKFDLKGLIGEKKYNEFYTQYKKSKTPTSVTTGVATILTFSDTSDLENLDYCYLQGFTGIKADLLNGKRFKFEILSATQIKLISVIRELTSSNIYFEDLDTTGGTITGGKCIEFAKFEYFELLRYFMVYASWIRYASTNKIESTEAGLVNKNLDADGFSNFISPQELQIAINRWKTDLENCKVAILKYLEVPKSVIASKKKRDFLIVKPKDIYDYKQLLKRDVR